MEHIWLNKRMINQDSIRMHLNHRIELCMIKYAEYAGGDPVEESDLTELDELAKDLIFDAWLELTDNIIDLDSRRKAH